jgi:hypothetical protein
MNQAGEDFDQPFAADSFDQAIAIAVMEIVSRGWDRPDFLRQLAEGE